MTAATCHPERKHLARGLCGACYWRDYARAGRPRQVRFTTEGFCQCGGPVYARRLCRRCYTRARTGARKAACHPDRRMIARGMCGACYARWRNANPEKRRAECLHTNRAAYGRKMCQPCCKLANLYHLDLVQVIAVTSARACEICRLPFDPKRRRAVDHDHVTGAFRGVLCSPCNTTLGLVRENVDTLRRCIQYLGRMERR